MRRQTVTNAMQMNYLSRAHKVSSSVQVGLDMYKSTCRAEQHMLGYAPTCLTAPWRDQVTPNRTMQERAAKFKPVSSLNQPLSACHAARLASGWQIALLRVNTMPARFAWQSPIPLYGKATLVST